MPNTPVCFFIDDDKDDQEIFSMALEESGIDLQLIIADDGCIALETLEADPDFIPGVIMLDINMPRLNGWQCLEQIKKIDRLQKVPVYMYSTSAAEYDRDLAERIGATGFIQKPSSVDELSELLQSTWDSSIYKVNQNNL
jgi:CheY-like chemotaxis protein